MDPTGGKDVTSNIFNRDRLKAREVGVSPFAVLLLSWLYSYSLGPYIYSKSVWSSSWRLHGEVIGVPVSPVEDLVLVLAKL